MMYYMPSIATPWRLGQALFAGGTLIVLTVGITALTCRTTLRENPAALMLPRAPKAGQAHPAGAHHPAVAAAALQLEGHLPQPAALQKAVLDDRHRRNRLHLAAGGWLWHL